jgi:hypothetical protein
MITVSGIEVTGGHFYLGQRMKPAGHNSGGYYDGNNEWGDKYKSEVDVKSHDIMLGVTYNF